jgi:hypothetical protein
MPEKNNRLYNLWLTNNFDAESAIKEIGRLGYYKEKYERRIDCYHDLAKKFISIAIKKVPKLDKKLHIDSSKISIGLVRYFNDAVHFKIWHPIEYLNSSRSAAYAARWLLVFQPISIALSMDEYASLDHDARKFVMGLHIAFASFVMDWFLEKTHAHSDTAKHNRVRRRFTYLAHKDKFEPRNFAAALEAL